MSGAVSYLRSNLGSINNNAAFAVIDDEDQDKLNTKRFEIDDDDEGIAASVLALRSKCEKDLSSIIQRINDDDKNNNNNNIPSDEFLIKCIRQRKGDIDKCMEVIRGYLEFRISVCWELCISLEKVDHGSLSSGMHWLLRDKYRRAVIVFNPHYLDHKITTVEKYQHMGMYLMEQATNCPIVQTEGSVIVFDCRQLKKLSKDLSFITLPDIKRGFSMWLKAFPCKIKAIYVIGLNKITRVFVSSILAVLSKKLRKRITFVSSSSSSDDMTSKFVNEIGASCLPLDLGGDMPNFDWKDTVKRHIELGDSLL